jgi:oligopeptide transport system permease protein
MTSLGILVHDGAEDMDVATAALLVPGTVLVTLLVALTRAGEALRDRLAA